MALGLKILIILLIIAGLCFLIVKGKEKFGYMHFGNDELSYGHNICGQFTGDPIEDFKVKQCMEIVAKEKRSMAEQMPMAGKLRNCPSCQ
jgi:hypothetical protein